tara:strand:+ start:126 stop:569 length:444 start_codon:yes stop_codon:yes gene_type:complete
MVEHGEGRSGVVEEVQWNGLDRALALLSEPRHIEENVGNYVLKLEFTRGKQKSKKREKSAKNTNSKSRGKRRKDKRKGREKVDQILYVPLWRLGSDLSSPCVIRDIVTDLAKSFTIEDLYLSCDSTLEIRVSLRKQPRYASESEKLL